VDATDGTGVGVARFLKALVYKVVCITDAELTALRWRGEVVVVVVVTVDRDDGAKPGYLKREEKGLNFAQQKPNCHGRNPLERRS
jgi:hypothetical protein